MQQSTKTKPHQFKYFRGAIPERIMLSFSARPLCLCYVPLHINHYRTSHLGESVLAFGLLSLTVSLLPGTMLTLCIILCNGYQMAQGKAMLLSITTHPRTPVVCSLYLLNITPI